MKDTIIQLGDMGGRKRRAGAQILSLGKFLDSIIKFLKSEIM